MSGTKRKSPRTKSKSKSFDETASSSKKSKKSTTDDSTTSEKGKNNQFILLEVGHVDFLRSDKYDDEYTVDEKKKRGRTEQRVYLVLTPRGTQDKTAKRRLIFTKTRVEDNGPHAVRIENLGKEV
jgi:hypothetical protein